MAKLYYEKNGAIYKSESGFPAEQPAKADKIVDRDVLEGHALVYGKKNDAGVMEIRVSETGIPDAKKDLTITELQNQADCGTEHDYTDTKEPKDDKCDTCGKAGHTWDDGVVDPAATCGTAGIKTFTCTVCGATKTEEIPATGEHTYGEDGICTVCGAVKPAEE